MPRSTLSRREREVCELLVEGLKLREVALRLNISIHTVARHKASIYRKFAIHDRSELLERFPPPNLEPLRDAPADSMPPLEL